MRIRKSKTLTPAARIKAANERTSTALFVFEQAAVELDGAADDLNVIEAETAYEAQVLRAQAEALDAQSYAAFERAEQVREQAETIRGLVGMTTGNA